MKRILIAEPKAFSPNAVTILARVGEVEQRECDRAALAAAFAEFDAVWVRLAHRIDGEMLGERPRCRVIATATTGLDHLDLDACAARNVRVVSLRGETAFLQTVRGTAELTIGLALALLRRLPAAAADVRAGHWNRDAFRGRELYGRTAGIIGMGRLGGIVADYLAAFGMKVVGRDRHSGTSLDALLAESDLVSLHVTYDASTRHLLGARELARMKPGAVLINTSRGAVIDENALLDALRSGRLAGAALDVLDGEPTIDSSHPLVAYACGHDNLLIVPHIGGNTVESFEKTETFLAQKVVEALG